MRRGSGTVGGSSAVAKTDEVGKRKSEYWKMRVAFESLHWSGRGDCHRIR